MTLSNQASTLIYFIESLPQSLDFSLRAMVTLVMMLMPSVTSSQNMRCGSVYVFDQQRRGRQTPLLTARFLFGQKLSEKEEEKRKRISERERSTERHLRWLLQEWSDYHELGK